MEVWKKRKFIFILIIWLLFFLFILQPYQGKNPKVYKSFCIFSLATFFWATDLLPLAITGLIVLGLIPAFGILPAKVVFSYFGNEAVFFIIGVFILSSGMMKSGLALRMAFFILMKYGKTPSRLVISVALITCLLSLLMPEHAVAAMIFPVVLEIAHCMKLKRGESQLGKALFLALCWGSVIGGVGTLLGGARNALAIALLKDYGITKNQHYNISFFYWIEAAIPFVVLMIATCIIILLIIISKEKDNYNDMEIAKAYIRERVNEIKIWNSSEKIMLGIMLITILLWILFGDTLGLAIISIFSATTIVIFGIVSWVDIEQYVSWGIILLYGGSIALGKTLHETHAFSYYLKDFLIGLEGSSIFFGLIISFSCLLLTEFISNSAVVAIVLPLVLELSDYLSMNPIAAVFYVAIPSGLAFMLPVGTPPNAIAYSSGYYKIKDSVKFGMFLNIFALIIFNLIAITYWKLIGLFIR